VIAKKRGLHTMYFCGLKTGDKPVWSYGLEHLAQRLTFATAENVVSTLRESGVFAMPAQERRKHARGF
jgi:hypothetical protein